MRKYLFIGFVLAFFLLPDYKTNAQDTVSYWGLNENSGTTTRESITNSDYSIRSKWAVIERVPGIRQTALRTDGYSTYVDGNVTNNYPVDFFSVSLWAAVETYPVNTAALWSYFDPVTFKGGYIAINKFGYIEVQFYANNQIVTATSSIRVEHYKWQHIVLNTDAVTGNCTVYINAVQVASKTFQAGNLGWPAIKTYLGRGAAIETTQSIFPVNYINGIVDEIIVRKRVLTPAEISQEFNLLNPASPPDMATPLSRFANDFHRPKYHAIPNNNWCNESHGLIRYNNTYHMFYQKNGNGPYFSQQNWGHLTSTDLVTWQEKQVALFPQPGWESVGAWSGHCVLDNAGTPTIIYTGVDGVKAGIGAAQSTGALLNWNKNVANPLLPAAPPTPANRDFRDPYVFKEGSTWYMIVGSGLQSPSTGTVFLYKSTDLVSWQFINPLFTDQSGQNNVGIFWEMPIFWKFGNRYMLLVNKTPQGSVPAKSFYWVGNFVNETLVPNNPLLKNLDIINSLLSPTVNLDDQNRVTAIGIIPDLLPGSEQYTHGWANVFSLPRIWQLVNDSLFQSPHPNLDASRGQLTPFSNLTLQPAASNYINLRGFRAEIKATINTGTASKVGFIIEKNDTNTEFTKIYYNVAAQSFVVDRSKSSLNSNTPRDIQEEPFPLIPGQPIDWQIYIDGSVIEVFINNKWAFATRIYPTGNTSNIIDLFSEGGNATATTVQVWNRGDLTGVITGIFTPAAPQYKSLRVWPVPASEKCYIQIPGNVHGKSVLTIFDNTGKQINQLQKPVNTTSSHYIEVDIKKEIAKTVPSGIYFCTLNFNDKDFYQVKLVIANK